jgi:hypothetical protein
MLGVPRREGRHSPRIGLARIVAALRTVNSTVKYTEYPDVGHDL